MKATTVSQRIAPPVSQVSERFSPSGEIGRSGDAPAKARAKKGDLSRDTRMTVGKTKGI